jgi:hypothetical protein
VKDTARLVGCAPASVGKIPKWTLIVQNMTDSRSRLHQIYSALYGVHTDVLRDLMAVLKESFAKGERAKTTTADPPTKEGFREQR